MYFCFERTTDYQLVRGIFTTPEVYRRLGDDRKPKPEDAMFLFHGYPHVSYVLAKAIDEAGQELLAGVFMVVASADQRSCECHFAILPEFWGSGAKIAGKFMEWLWANTRHTKAIGQIRGDNRLALRVAKRCGFEAIDVKKDQFVRHGKKVSQIVVLAERPKVNQ